MVEASSLMTIGAGALLAALSLVETVSAATADPKPPSTGAVASEEIDDPKVARRLKRRVLFPVEAPAVAAPPTVVAAALAPAPTAHAGTLREETTIVREPGAAPPPATSSDRKVPRLKLGYRRFSFVRPGTTNPGTTTGAAASQAFNSVSLDLYPLSWYVRMGLSTQYGWESGRFNSGGDYFIAQSFSLGGQLPGQTFTPFFEGFAGGGYMRRVQFERTIPTAYWQLGVDAGVEFFLARYAFISAALGYLHPVNGFARETSFASVYVDTWSFKLGFGL